MAGFNAFLKSNNIVTGTQIPTEGNYKTGDIVINIGPNSASEPMWICNEGGNPGVWGPVGVGGGSGSIVSINSSVMIDEPVHEVSLESLGVAVTKKDKLIVHYNSVHLLEGVHFEIAGEGTKIVKLGNVGEWNTEGLEECMFAFELFKGVQNIDGNEITVASKMTCKTNHVIIENPCGEVEIGIEGFKSENDTLMVFKNGVIMVEGVDYTIEGDIITSTGEVWNENRIEDYGMTFVVFKEIPVVDEGAVIDSSLLSDELKNRIYGLGTQTTERIYLENGRKQFNCDSNCYIDDIRMEGYTFNNLLESLDDWYTGVEEENAHAFTKCTKQHMIERNTVYTLVNVADENIVMDLYTDVNNPEFIRYEIPGNTSIEITTPNSDIQQQYLVIFENDGWELSKQYFNKANLSLCMFKAPKEEVDIHFKGYIDSVRSVGGYGVNICNYTGEKIEFISSNGNISLTTGSIIVYGTSNFMTEFIDVSEYESVFMTDISHVILYDENKNFIKSVRDVSAYSICDVSKASYIKLWYTIAAKNIELIVPNKHVVKKEVIGLHRLPNGTVDYFEKCDNVYQIVNKSINYWYVGSYDEDWTILQEGTNCIVFQIPVEYKMKQGVEVISNYFLWGENIDDTEHVWFGQQTFYVSINKSRLSEPTVAGFKIWLQNLKYTFGVIGETEKSIKTKCSSDVGLKAFNGENNFSISVRSIYPTISFVLNKSLDENLSTVIDKITNLELAINQLFQDVDSAKQRFASAIGGNITGESSFEEMINEIIRFKDGVTFAVGNDYVTGGDSIDTIIASIRDPKEHYSTVWEYLKGTESADKSISEYLFDTRSLLMNKLNAKGVTMSDTTSLYNGVALIDKINVGKKFATGTFSSINNNTYQFINDNGSNLYAYVGNVSSLDFKPSTIIVTLPGSDMQTMIFYSSYISEYMIYRPGVNNYNRLQIAANAVINSTGFWVPLPTSGVTYTWIAYE